MMRDLMVASAVLSMWAACSGGDDNPFEVDAGAPAPDAAVLVGSEPELYGGERSLSPITPYVADNLRAIADRDPTRSGAVFAKVGAAESMSQNFMHCFDDGYTGAAPGQEPGAIDLDGLDEDGALARAIAHFRDGDAAGANPYRRTSRAAAVGWTADDVLDGALTQEFDAINPRFAVIAFGANDLPSDAPDAFGSNLFELADASIAAGVIPIFTAMLPRTDDPIDSAEVSHYNAVVRGVAQARQVPFIDWHRAVRDAPGAGLGVDGVRPSVYRPDADALGCAFHSAGLEHGYNARNLLTMQTLARLQQVVVDGEPALDNTAGPLLGSGTAADPFVIDSLPFTHTADTEAIGVRVIDSYEGCQANQNESGPEVMYRLQLDSSTRVRAMVIDRGDTDIDVHVLADGTGGDACVSRDHQLLSADLAPGTYYFSLDTFVGSGGEQSGEYLFTLTEEQP